MHDPHIRDAPRSVTDTARLSVRWDWTENRPAFRILGDNRGTAILLHVRSADRIRMTGGAHGHIGRG